MFKDDLSKPAIDRLLAIMDYLQTSPDGCAWTQEQTHQSLSQYLIEESYETAELLDSGQHGDSLRDELGDLLLQISFHAAIAKRRRAFEFEDVAQAIVDKLIRRYPTILGDEPNTLKTPEEIDRRWEEIKTEERKKKRIVEKEASILDEISPALPALLRAAKLKGRAAKAGWEWPNVEMLLDKISEEIGELKEEIEKDKKDKTRIAAELGDLMFLLVDFGRWYGVDAEDALRTTNSRFEKRFRYMESGLKKQGKDFKSADRPLRVSLWEEAKRLEKESA